MTFTPAPTPLGGGSGVIAYVSEQTGNPEVLILHLDTNTPTQVTRNNGVDSSPAWSPSGRLLAFITDQSGQGAHVALAASGLPGVEAASFTGVLGPAGLPRPVLDRLQKAVLVAANKPQVVQRFREIGADPRALGAAEFTQFLRAELERWKGVATKASISITD